MFQCTRKGAGVLQSEGGNTVFAQWPNELRSVWTYSLPVKTIVVTEVVGAEDQ